MKNLILLATIFAMIALFTSCETDELNTFEQDLNLPEENSTSAVLDENTIEILDSVSVLQEDSGLESRSNLIFEKTVSLTGSSWYLVLFDKHNLHPNCKYIAKVIPHSGDPDLYVHGKNYHGQYREIRRGNSNNSYEETYAYQADLRHDENKLSFSVYADNHHHTNFKIQIFKDCGNGGGEHTCCSNDPLSQHWVKNVISELCHGGYEGSEIWCATYNGQTVINRTSASNYLADVGAILYDCHGNVVKNYGFYGQGGELHGTLVNHKKLWDYSQCNGGTSGGCTIVEEDFQHYDFGYKIAYNSKWATWSHTNSASINGHPLEYGGKVLGLSNSHGKQSALRFLNDAHAGRYEISWDMEVPHNANAGFGIYGKSSASNYFSIKGINIVNATYKGQARHYVCTIDLDANTITIKIGHDTIVHQSIPHHANLGLLAFHTLDGYHSSFWVDNLKVVKLNCQGGYSNSIGDGGRDFSEVTPSLANASEL